MLLYCLSIQSNFVKKGLNSKNLAYKIMPLVLQFQLVMTSKCSKFQVDIFKT